MFYSDKIALRLKFKNLQYRRIPRPGWRRVARQVQQRSSCSSRTPRHRQC